MGSIELESLKKINVHSRIKTTRRLLEGDSATVEQSAWSRTYEKGSDPFRNYNIGTILISRINTIWNVCNCLIIRSRRIFKSNLPVIIEITTFGGIVSSPTWRVKPEWRGGTTRDDKRAIKSDRRAPLSLRSRRVALLQRIRTYNVIPREKKSGR